MTRARAIALALVVLATTTASGDGAGDATAQAPPEFPLGPWVRAGRPVLIRAPGARRVRGGGSPWALPQGAAADEFLLRIHRADVTLRELEIDDGPERGVRTHRLDVRPLPQGGTLRAVFRGAPQADAVLVGSAGLPTVPEAWLLFDEVDVPPDGLPPAARAAVDAWRAGPRSGDEGRAAFQPHLALPGAAAFAASVDVAAAAPRLPRDVALALVVTALAEAAVLALAAGRSALRRAAWLAAAPVACLVWLVADARLPGAVRATTFSIEGPFDRLVLLRLDAPRGGTASFRVPEVAGAPTILRFDADDRSAADAEVGREVRMSIPAGQSRLVAWRMPPAEPAAHDGDVASEAIPPALGAWVASLGLDAIGQASPSAPEVEDARGFRAVRGAAVRVSPRPATRK